MQQITVNGNELVFGQNAGQQCVAMSLCSLIYNTRQRISSGRDLRNIMNIGINCIQVCLNYQDSRI